MKNCIILLTILFICSGTSKLSTPIVSTVSNNSSPVDVNMAEGLVHTVFFWYAEDADPTRLAEFENDLKELGKVPSISSYYYGPPAATAERGFVEKCKDLWEKVVVYDNQISR
jgi:hypothetical protein